MKIKIEEIINIPQISSLKYERYEQFFCIYIASKRIISYHYSRGTAFNVKMPYPEEIAKKYKEYNANGVILLHNHPGGGLVNLLPSSNDIKNFIKLRTELSYKFNVNLVDSIIITTDNYISIKQLQNFL